MTDTGGAGEMPKMPPLSKLAPLLLMFALNKYDLDKLGYRQWCEAAFIGVQVGCFIALNMIHASISARPESDSASVRVPAETAMGKEVKPAREMTEKEYDLDKFKELRTQQLMGAVILGAVYYNWKSLLPLVLQTVMTPLNLMESPLFQIYIFNTNVERPFPKPNPFGLPPPPDPAPETQQLEPVDSADAGWPFITAEFGVRTDATGLVCRAVPFAADAELSNGIQMQGRIAVVQRGVVPFVDKARRAAEAGAVAVVVVNDEEACYRCTAPGVDTSDVKIPVVCVGSRSGPALIDGTSITITGVNAGRGKLTIGDKKRD